MYSFNNFHYWFLIYPLHIDENGSQNVQKPEIGEENSGYVPDLLSSDQLDVSTPVYVDPNQINTKL